MQASANSDREASHSLSILFLRQPVPAARSSSPPLSEGHRLARGTGDPIHAQASVAVLPPLQTLEALLCLDKKDRIFDIGNGSVAPLLCPSELKREPILRMHVLQVTPLAHLLLCKHRNVRASKLNEAAILLQKLDLVEE